MSSRWVCETGELKFLRLFDMERMISLQRCRKILGPKVSVSDEKLAALREQLAATLQSRLDALKMKRQRVIDAFLHERCIDKATYQDQVNLINEEIALTEL